MTILVDAHLPKSLCQYFKKLGHNALHTSNLPAGNATDDDRIALFALEMGAVVISKDIDFFHSFQLFRRPPKLVMVKIGNMKLADVRTLFERKAEVLVAMLETHDLIEFHRDRIVAIE